MTPMNAQQANGLAGDAFVAIWHDLAPEGLETFYQWHDREHMPERLAIPGFRRGRRYLRVEGDGQDYFNLYEVDTFQVLVGEAYLARLNAPTPWTKQALPYFRNVSRGLCRVAGSQGMGHGGMIATLRLSVAEARAESLQWFLLAEAFPALLGCVGVLSAHLGVTDAAGSGIKTVEQQARNNATEVPSWVLLIEGTSAERLRTACGTTLTTALLKERGAVDECIMGTYRLESMRRGIG
ncbi:MAG: hypothetical protein HZA92_02720 [Verrucomicrobia bacterium]|nr:hypothetical protein [Verrucomicrobiota bacterium]